MKAESHLLHLSHQRLPFTEFPFAHQLVYYQQKSHGLKEQVKMSAATRYVTFVKKTILFLKDGHQIIIETRNHL